MKIIYEVNPARYRAQAADFDRENWDTLDVFRTQSEAIESVNNIAKNYPQYRYRVVDIEEE